MNINANTGTLKLFKQWVSGKTGTQQGYRASVVTFKTDSKTGVKRDSMYAELPVLTSDDIKGNVGLLCEAIRYWCEDAQDSIVRDAVVAGKAGVELEEVGLDAIAAWVREQLSSGRLTGVAVAEWYAESMEAMLALVLAEKLGINEHSSEAMQKQLEGTLEVYKKNIVALSSGRTKYDKDTARKLLRAFEVTELVNTEDDVGSKLVSKLRLMIQEPRTMVQMLEL